MEIKKKHYYHSAFDDSIVVVLSKGFVIKESNYSSLLG